MEYLLLGVAPIVHQFLQLLVEPMVKMQQRTKNCLKIGRFCVGVKLLRRDRLYLGREKHLSSSLSILERSMTSYRSVSQQMQR